MGLNHLLAVFSASVTLAADHAMLQRLLDKGGAVRIPAGVHRIARPLVVRLAKSGPVSIRGEGVATIVMAGAGPAIHLIGSHAGTADPKTVKPTVWQRERMPLVDGIEIVGRHAEADGIRAEGTMQLTVTRVTARELRHAIHLTGRARNAIVSECHLYNNRGVGVLMEKLSLHQVNIANSHISYNGGGGVVARDSEIRNLQIGTSDIEANMAEGGEPAANVLLDVRSGSIREASIVGCTLQHSGTAKDSANIRLIGASERVANKVGYLSIADNVLSDVAVNVHLRHARGVSIVGNTFAVAYRHDILVEGSSNVVIGPNAMDQNPDYNRGEIHNGIVFADSSDSTLNGVHINGAVRNEAAIVLRRCRRINVTGATILDSDGAGILLEDSEWTRISQCMIRDDRAGAARRPMIRVKGGANNIVRDNTLSGPVEAAGTARVEGNIQ